MFSQLKNNHGYAGLIILLITLALIVLFFYASQDFYAEREIIKEQANQTVNIELQTMNDNIVNSQSEQTLEDLLAE